MMKPAEHNYRSGFTLLETMYVVAAMALLSGIVMGTFLFLNRAGAAMTASHSTQAGARHALLVMSDDIRSAGGASATVINSLELVGNKDGRPSTINYVVEDNILKRRDGSRTVSICGGIGGMRIGFPMREGADIPAAKRTGMVRVTLDFVETRGGRTSTNTFSALTAMRNTGS